MMPAPLPAKCNPGAELLGCGPWILRHRDLFSESLLLVLNVKLWPLNHAFGSKNPSRSLNCLRTIQRHSDHQAQADWPLFGGTYILNLHNTINWLAKTKNETLISGYKLLQRAIIYSYIYGKRTRCLPMLFLLKDLCQKVHNPTSPLLLLWNIAWLYPKVGSGLHSHNSLALCI